MITKSKEFLKCLLTEAELKERADKMALCLSQIREREDALKSIKKQMESDIAKAEAELSLASEQYRSGFEMRFIDCETDKDFRIGRVSMTRLDTGESVWDRAMTAEERQGELFEDHTEVGPADPLGQKEV